MTSVLGSAKARKQSMAVSGLLRVEKKEAGTKTGQKEQAPEAFPQRQSQHVEVGAFQLSFLRLSSGSHTASTAPLGLILHFFLGALDFISFYKALILRKDERRRGDKDEEKKELNLALTAWHSDTIRKFKNTRGFGCGGRRREQVHPSPLLCPPSLPPCSRGRLIMYKYF